MMLSVILMKIHNVYEVYVRNMRHARCEPIHVKNTSCFNDITTVTVDANSESISVCQCK